MTSEGEQASRQPTEEELRAAYEAEIKKVRVEHILLEQIVTLINIGRRRTGLSPGTEDERDPDQVRLAVESVRALLPLVEQAAPEQVAPIREALSQLQLAYVRIGGQQPAAQGGLAEGRAHRVEQMHQRGAAKEVEVGGVGVGRVRAHLVAHR